MGTQEDVQKIAQDIRAGVSRLAREDALQILRDTAFTFKQGLKSPRIDIVVHQSTERTYSLDVMMGRPRTFQFTIFHVDFQGTEGGYPILLRSGLNPESCMGCLIEKVLVYGILFYLRSSQETLQRLLEEPNA